MLINKSILFLHIPRTAGRFIKNNIANLNVNDVFFFKYKEYFYNQETAHLTYRQYQSYLNHLSLKKFSITRDPVDRFISMLNSYNKINEEKIDSMFKSQESFDECVTNFAIHNNSNWFKPQVEFVGHDVKTWKFEDKFDKDFNEWLFSNFKIKLNDQNKFDPKENILNIELNKKQIEYIKNYYYQDYKIFNY